MTVALAGDSLLRFAAFLPLRGLSNRPERRRISRLRCVTGARPGDATQSEREITGAKAGDETCSLIGGVAANQIESVEMGCSHFDVDQVADEGRREDREISNALIPGLSAPEKQSVPGRVHLTFSYRSYGF